jgi:SAM-dependent methyltransferase
MLRLAWSKLGGWAPRLHLLHADADRLPFDDASFDAVTCLEALEFTPRPLRTLRELARVLRPGGVLCVTNRVGWEAPLLPGRAFGRSGFEVRLRALGLADVETRRWQTYYDLVWARRPGPPEPGPAGSWPAGLRCPRCGGRLVDDARRRLACGACAAEVTWDHGAWDMIGSGG